VVVSDPTESALLPTEGPEGRHSRHASEFLVNDNDVIWLGSSEEELLDHSSDLDVGDLSLDTIVEVKDVVHGIGAEIKDSEEISGVALEHVEWLSTVHVSARREAIIDGVGLINVVSGVDSALLVCVEQATSSLSHSHKREVSGWV
jgi:hypothetical protein